MLAGLIRTLGTIILDRMFGGRRRRSRNPDANPNSGSNAGGASAKKSPPKDSKLGDYIDFEEVDD